VPGTEWDDANVGPYSTAMGRQAKASGYGSTALGNGVTATGNSSTALGGNLTAGADVSTAIGQASTATGVGSITIGSFLHADGDFSLAMGKQASTNGQTGAFVYGDGSHTTAFSSDVLQAPAPNSFTVRASGGVTFYTSADLSTGVHVSTGDGSWSSVSDRRKKEHFRDEAGERVLAQIAGMPLQSWNYKSQDSAIRHLGPTAQDFYAAFHLGESDTTISTVDADGVSLLAIQALEQRTRDEAQELGALRTDNAALRAELTALRAALDSLVQKR